jgi:hypothetical protein
MILVMTITCVGILRLQFLTENGLQIVLYSIKLQIVIFRILYAQSWHIWTTDNDLGWMVPVMAVPCIFLPAAWFQNYFHYNSSRNASNCWRIVIFCILYAWHLHIWDFDTDFWLFIILFMEIPCIGN